MSGTSRRGAPLLPARVETRSRPSGTVTVMERSPSDAECLALSLGSRRRSSRSSSGISSSRCTAPPPALLARELADELAAETFALAFERRATCRAEGSVLPWLYGIATNLLRRRRRTEQRQLRAYGRSGADRGVVYDEAVAGRRRSRRPARARPRGDAAAERDALLLYALAELSYDEIALALDVPVGTVRTWLHRARRVANASSRPRRTLSPLATQELISMDELDLFRDFRRGVAAPSDDARRRASARLATASRQARRAAGLSRRFVLARWPQPPLRARREPPWTGRRLPPEGQARSRQPATILHRVGDHDDRDRPGLQRHDQGRDWIDQRAPHRTAPSSPRRRPRHAPAGS